nr:hypothetical protein CFP56_12414 [Quercus suber]
MATRYSKEKYVHIRGLKNEPLSNLAANLKKWKLSKEKGEAVAFPSIQVASSSPTPSLEVTAFTPLPTYSKGKGKAGRSIPATVMGHAHNVIIDDKLKGLSSIPFHELVSPHIHKWVQVLGKSLHIITDYLSTEEKAVVANSRWTMMHHSLVVDFSNLDFKKIDTEILTDEAKNKKKLKLMPL